MILTVLTTPSNTTRQIIQSHLTPFELIEKPLDSLFDIVKMPDFKLYFGIAITPSILGYSSNDFATVIHLFQKLKLSRTMFAIPIRGTEFKTYVMSTHMFFQLSCVDKLLNNVQMSFDDKISWLCTQSNFERCDYSGVWS